MTTARVLFRCDGSHRLGLGHLVRCGAIATALTEHWNTQVGFAVREGPEALAWHKTWRPDVPLWLAPPQARDSETWFGTVVRDFQPHAIVFDVRDDWTPEMVRRVAGADTVKVILDDGSPRRLAADLVFYPPVPQVGELDWTGFDGELRVGWEWIALRSQFAEYHAKGSGNGSRLLVLTGGSDPGGLAFTVAHSLRLVRAPIQATFVLGAAFQGQHELEQLLGSAGKPWRILRALQDVAPVMAGMGAAVSAFGVSAYELACVGVPALLLCASEDHLRSAQACVSAGVADCLGLIGACSPQRIAQGIDELWAQDERRFSMARQGPKLVDGRGAYRIAHSIQQRINAGLAAHAGEPALPA